MPLPAFSYLRRTILVGLMAAIGIVSAASQTPTISELTTLGIRTDPGSMTKPVPAPVASNSLPTTANPPRNGPKLKGSVGRGNPLWAIPLASLTATRDRPIFSPTRRPTPVIVKSDPIQSPLAERPLLALVGAIAGKDEGIAIFQDEITKGIIRLKTGESHSGWTLQLVKAREATLQKEHKTAILVLPNPPAK